MTPINSYTNRHYSNVNRIVYCILLNACIYYSKICLIDINIINQQLAYIDNNEYFSRFLTLITNDLC